VWYFNKQAPVDEHRRPFYGQRSPERSGVAALNGAVCQRGTADAAQRKERADLSDYIIAHRGGKIHG
jgi:hypothetical protein